MQSSEIRKTFPSWNIFLQSFVNLASSAEGFFQEKKFKDEYLTNQPYTNHLKNAKWWRYIYVVNENIYIYIKIGLLYYIPYSEVGI